MSVRLLSYTVSLWVSFKIRAPNWGFTMWWDQDNLCSQAKGKVALSCLHRAQRHRRGSGWCQTDPTEVGHAMHIGMWNLRNHQERSRLQGLGQLRVPASICKVSSSRACRMDNSLSRTKIDRRWVNDECVYRMNAGFWCHSPSFIHPSFQTEWPTDSHLNPGSFPHVRRPHQHPTQTPGPGRFVDLEFDFLRVSGWRSFPQKSADSVRFMIRSSLGSHPEIWKVLLAPKRTLTFSKCWTSSVQPSITSGVWRSPLSWTGQSHLNSQKNMWSSQFHLALW